MSTGPVHVGVVQALEGSFLVDVPEGCNKLDLRPILMPLALSLARMAMGHRVCERDVEEMLLRNNAERALIERMVRIRPEWVRRYLGSTGWLVHQQGAFFRASTQQRSLGRATASLMLWQNHKESENGVKGYWAAFSEIARWERCTIDEAVLRVEQSVSAVDLLAMLVRDEA